MGLQLDVLVKALLTLRTLPVGLGGRVIPVPVPRQHLDEAGQRTLKEVDETGRGGHRHTVVGRHVLLEVARVLKRPVALLAHVDLARVPIINSVS